MKASITITLGASLLAGCTVGPVYQTPKEAVPGTWGSSQAGLYETSPVRPDWWR